MTRKKSGAVDQRKYSRLVVDGAKQTPSRAMLRAVGFQDADFAKPQIGVASTWASLTPCNIHINDLATEALAGADAAGGKGVLFNTITVSDGISMGSPGMRYSLVSREVIADSIETVVGAEGFDGVVAIGGCDKNMPGCAMAIARLNRPAVFVYGGTIKPGAKRRDIVSVFEAVGGHAAGRVSDAELLEVERTAIPGPGKLRRHVHRQHHGVGHRGTRVCRCLTARRRKRSAARSTTTAAARARRWWNWCAPASRRQTSSRKKAFENAITMTIALGGSTNAVLHLLAIAHAAKVRLGLQDFTRIGKRVPLLADVRPSGRYLMSELIAIGGIQPLMKRLLDAGLLHGECLTVTGRTLAENLRDVADYPPGQDIVRPLSDPIKKDSHLVVMYGNLAPEGAVAKISGKEGLRFAGTARVFDGEERATTAILAGKVKPGDVVVIRNEGPRGGPGMREMLSPTGAIMGRGLGDKVALITDGRFSGGSHGFVVGHISPEAALGGPIGLLRDGDRISIDAIKRTLSIELSAAELRRRRAKWTAPKPYATKGVLAKYARNVSSASLGAVTD